MLPFLHRSVFALSAATVLPVLFSGCFTIKMRELRTQVQIRDARITQLQQDLDAHRDRADSATREAAELARRVEVSDGSVALLRSELGLAGEKLAASRVALNTSVDSSKRDLGQRLADSMRLEQELKNQIGTMEDSKSRLEGNLLKAEADRDAAAKELAESKVSLEGRLRQIEELESALGQEKQSVVLLKASQESEQAKWQNDNTTTSSRLNAEHEAKLRELTTTSEAKVAEMEVATKDLKTRMEEEIRRAETLATELRQAKDTVTAADKARADEEAARTAAAAALPAPIDLAAKRDQAGARLKTFVDSGAARIEVGEKGIRVILFSDELFQPATTLLSDQGLRALSATNDFLQESKPIQITVQGHTDNIPVRNMPYPDNWELAGARAAEVVRWLASKPGAEPGRIVAQSHSYHTPLGENSTPAGRRLNRRVEVVVGF